MKTVRQDRRHILGRMDGEIDSPVRQRLLDFFGEKPLAADFGKRAILNAVARRRHGNDFYGFFRKTMCLHQAATRLVSLGESKLAAPRAYLQRAILQGCCLHIASSMVPDFSMNYETGRV